MNTKILKSHFQMNKLEKITFASVLGVLTLSIATLNIYWIAGKFGITLAPGWYTEIVDFVANGGTLVEAFAVIAGIALPAWVGVVVAGFGLASA